MEIVVRAAVVFAFLWLITRAVGRSTLGELSTFELMLYVTMGDLVQQGVTQQDQSLTSAILAVGVFALLTVALSYANWRWPRCRPLVHGVPVVEADGKVSFFSRDPATARLGSAVRRLRLRSSRLLSAFRAYPSPGRPEMLTEHAG